MTAPETPKRIQRRRTDGWTMPEGAVYVGRHTRRNGRPTLYGRWGNPFRIGDRLSYPYSEVYDCARVRDAAHAVELFAAYARITSFYTTVVRMELAGKTLACWCKVGDPCHGDVLLAIANAQPCPECGPGYRYGDDGCRHTPAPAGMAR